MRHVPFFSASFIRKQISPFDKFANEFDIKFKEDKIRVMLVQETEELLLLQREMLQLVHQEEKKEKLKCTQPKRPRNDAWFNEKLMLAEAQEAGQILDEEQLAFLADPDCDDLSLAKAVLMANLLSCDLEVLSKVPYFDSYPNDMIKKDVQEMQYSKQTHADDFQDNEIHNGSNIIPYSQYLQESQDAII
ncbi:hypothetical protein Tco_0051159 [Tanacetum coccineum]